MDWTSKIQKIFPRKGAVYLVTDRDYIFDNSAMIEVLRDHGVLFIDYIDPIHFRYHYEREFRFNRISTLIIRTDNFLKVPYDVYSQAYQIKVCLEDFLDQLDCSAAKESNKLVKELIELDSRQKYRLSYEETKSLLSREILIENYEEYALLEGHNYTTFGEAAMTIGRWRSETSSLDKERQKNIESLNSAFQNWLIKNFDQLVSLPPYPYPKIVHQIAEVMNQSEYNQKKALIVMDGMSFTQWQLINNYLMSYGFKTEVHPVLAWIPSVTSVSRQAIFSGKVPVRFADTIGTTNYEERQWQEYWISQGYKKTDIFYQRALGACDYHETDLSAKVSNRKVIGCVIDSVDKFIHSAQQGLWSLHSELNYWLEKGFLRMFLEDLLNNQYEIYITADHGNIEAVGVGRINQGILANSKGERVRIYDDEDIRHRTENDYLTVSQIWNSNFLPKKFYPLTAKENFAFIKKNDKIVSHGGTHVEEVYVPFVKVTR